MKSNPHSTIDLYTVNGEKLEEPLQLSNGAAYVAVKPPEYFIDTGYSQYLLKASRSWEKRQARRSNSIEITKPDVYTLIITESNTSVSKKKLKEDVATCEIDNNMVIPDTKVIDRPQALINAHEYPQKDSSAIYKQADKKRVSPIQRSSILRKSVTSPTATRKDCGKSKDVPRNSKGSFKVNEKSSINNSGTVTKSKVPQRNVTRISEEKPEQRNLKQNEAPNSMSDKVQNECVREKNNPLIVSNIFKSNPSEITSVILPLPARHNADDTDNKTLNNITDECNANEVIITTFTDNNAQKVDLFKNTIALNMEEDVGNQNNILNLSQIQRPSNVNFAEKSDQNYVVIKNGDIVKLKLQIEVRNGTGVVKNTSTTEQKTSLSTDIVKTEKGSQINLDSEMIAQNKSLQSIFKSELIGNIGIHGNSEAVVMKCICCLENNYSITNINTEASLSDNKMYVILLPNPEFENHLERCPCNKAMNIKDTEILQSTKSSPINPVKKTTSITALEILTSTTVAKLAFPHSDKNTRKPTVECVNIHSESKSHIAIIQNEIMNPKDVNKNDSQTKSTDNIDSTVLTENTKTLAKCREITSSATQTQLCCLLLEARRHEDGHYTFHLPPLKILKYYKL